MRRSFRLENLDCANCAAKMEDGIKRIDGVTYASINFMAKKLTLEAPDGIFDDVVRKAVETCKKIEPEMRIAVGREIFSDRGQRIILTRIIVSLALFLIAVFLYARTSISIVLFVLSYVVAGYDIILTAMRNLLRGRILDENFLMTIASVGAFCIGEYHEAVAVMIFYRVGSFFENYAVNKTRKSVSELMGIRPDHAVVIRNGEAVYTDPAEVLVGELIVVDPGQRIPLDGIIEKGYTSVDNSDLTGESLPVDLSEGEAVVSGGINLTGAVTVRVTKPFDRSTVSRILDLVETAAEKKAKTEGFITRFARFYTPAVVIAALVIAIVPSLITGNWNEWLHRALIFLVASCPCALVISVPMSFFGGIGGASRQGILIKGSSYIEALSKAEIIAFDKTGTLTEGKFRVTEITPVDVSADDLLRYAALAESHSFHPIAKSLVSTFGGDICKNRILVEEIAGMGVKTVVDGKSILVGNLRFMRHAGVEFVPQSAPGTVLYVSEGEKYLGHITLADTPKKESYSLIEGLKALGIKKTVMLTGDNRLAGEAIGKELGIDSVRSELLPQDKVAEVEQLIGSTSKKGYLAYVGDGTNDAPVLSRADVGIAMGGLGSDAAIEAADVVIMDDDPLKVATAIRLSRRTMMIVKENIVFALVIKALVLLLGVLGLAGMWFAVFADVGVSVIAIFNAMRTLARVEKKVSKQG